MTHTTHTTHTTHITLDYNEKNKTIDRYLRQKGARPSYRELPCDYLCLIGEKAVAIERKRTYQFVSDIIDETARLDRQVADCLNYDAHIILLEGSWNYIQGAIATREKIYSPPLGNAFLTKLAKYILAGKRLHIIATPGPRETAELIWAIAKLAEKTNNGKDIDLSYYLERRSKKGKKEGIRAKINTLIGIPGVGEYRAIKLLDHFGSFRAIVEADEKEIAKVEGLGLKTAKKIKETLT